jgi:acyl-CoA thioester hydrolase
MRRQNCVVGEPGFGKTGSVIFLSSSSIPGLFTLAQPSPQQPFERGFPVNDADIDQMGHVNNTVYLRWVQEIAIAHWCSLTTADEQAAILWVVLRHEIDFLHPALREDGIIARTWVGEATGLSFERYTEILRARDRKPLARGRTLWCPIDGATGKPRRVSATVRERFSIIGPGTT